nr:protein nap1 [Quercus suber]
MRECILGNFRRRLLAVLKTDNDLQWPSILESLIRRHISIVHLAEQQISMDLTQVIREVLLTEAFSGPVSSLHLFEKVTEQPTGSAAEAVCNWYIENIIKDVSGAGILFVPIHKCFKSTSPVGGYFADSVADLRELQAFVRIFGGYGVDRLDYLLKEHTAALLNCIDTSLRSNREVLEAIAGSLHSGGRIEREASIKQVVDLDTVIEFCFQAGLALAFDGLLAEAAGAVLEEGAPLIYSLLAEVVKHVPDEIPEKKEIRRLKGVANSVGVVCDHDSQWVRSVLEEVGGANDGSWSLLPYLFATFMASNVWDTTAFNVETGGFNNNINCLARCISAVIAGSEFVRLERERQQRQSFSNGHVDETLDSEIQSCLSAEASIKSTLQLFVKFSAGIILDSWSETNRSNPVAQGRGDSTPQYLTNDSGYFKSASSSYSQEHIYDNGSGNFRGNENKRWNVCRSGPLDYSSSRKVEHGEGSTSGSTGPSPLPRFAVSSLQSENIFEFLYRHILILKYQRVRLNGSKSLMRDL